MDVSASQWWWARAPVKSGRTICAQFREHLFWILSPCVNALIFYLSWKWKWIIFNGHNPRVFCTYMYHKLTGKFIFIENEIIFNSWKYTHALENVKNVLNVRPLVFEYDQYIGKNIQLVVNIIRIEEKFYIVINLFFSPNMKGKRKLHYKF